MEERVENVPFLWMEESKGQLCVPMKMKRKVRSKKKEFVGWGSKQLIEFLQSIGKDTGKQLSQYDVTAIINEYVNEKNLIHPGKKKRILCDESLHFLFGRKSVGRIKIYDLLEAHFAENQEESDDGFLYSSEEREEDVLTACKKQKISCSDRKTHQKKNVMETPKSCFAAVISENIKLIYLKRSLVQDLLKYPETFENKLVGSFVRIKSDPNDYFQKNSHQLLQVTGVKKASGTGDISTEILLQVSNFIKEIHICILSDDNFSEEECEDLHQRVKDGLLKRPTVVELEQKVRILHEDITKHWLARELSLLQNLIDRANEKGWRRELFEYMERKQLLQTPSEQSRLLLEVPKVIAEEIEPEATVQDFPDNVNQGANGSPRSILRGASEIPVYDLAADGTASTRISDSTDDAGLKDVIITSKVFICDSSVGGEGNRGFINGITSGKEGKGIQTALLMPKQDSKMGDVPDFSVQEQQKPPIEIRDESNGETQLVNLENKGFQRDKQVMATAVIDLSDDEDEDLKGGNPIPDDHVGSSIWNYMDPQGEIQGPFSMTLLKRWSDADYFPPGFKVWKTGQREDEAILLSDMLCWIFPN